MFSFEVSVDEPTFDSDESEGNSPSVEPVSDPEPEQKQAPKASQRVLSSSVQLSRTSPAKPPPPTKRPPQVPKASPLSSPSSPPSQPAPASSPSQAKTLCDSTKSSPAPGKAEADHDNDKDDEEIMCSLGDAEKRKSFKHNFWGRDRKACFLAANGVGNATSASDKEGMDLLERVTGVSADSLQELVNFMQERAEAEEQYSKRLRKIAGVPESSDESLGTALGTFKDDISSGMRILIAEVTEEARQQFLAHKSLAKTYENAAATLRECLKNFKATRKTLLGEASAATKEKMQLEANVKKQKSKYVDTVVKKDGAMAAVATLESQGRSPQDIAKQRAKAQKCAKEEMVADQELKEAVDKLSAYHPMWIARMQSMMDGLQQYEQKRLETVSTTLVTVSKTHLSLVPVLSEVQSQTVASSESLNAKQELIQWVARAHTGSAPSLPPVYLPRASRQRLVDAIADPFSDIAPPQVQMSASHLQSSVSLNDISGAAASAVQHSDSTAMGGDLSSSTRAAADSSYAFSSGTSASPSATQVARVIKRFIGETPDEIDLQVNDTIMVISTCSDVNTGWWIGRNRGRIGWFPATFVELTS